MRFRNGAIPVSCLVLTGFSVGAGAAGEKRAVLSVYLQGLESNRGHIGCALYDSEQGFPKDRSRATQSKWCDIGVKKTSRCAFEPIPRGTYAVVCFHDENDNRELDTGLFGIPTEGLAVSNDAHGFMGPPKWKDAQFRFDATATQIQPTMSY